MKVKDMIEWLETLDQELDVDIGGWENDSKYTSRPLSIKKDTEVGECSLLIEKGAGYE